MKNKLVYASCSQRMITWSSLSKEIRWKKEQSQENCAYYKATEICAAKAAIRDQSPVLVSLKNTDFFGTVYRSIKLKYINSLFLVYTVEGWNGFIGMKLLFLDFKIKCPILS